MATKSEDLATRILVMYEAELASYQTNGLDVRIKAMAHTVEVLGIHEGVKLWFPPPRKPT